MMADERRADETPSPVARLAKAPDVDDADGTHRTNGHAPKAKKPARVRVEIDARFFKLTETGNAERFAAMHKGRVRYCPPWGKWLLWDETRWAVDTRGDAMALAKDTVRAIYAEAARCEDEGIRKAIAMWAHKSESRAARSAMLELAQSEAGITVLPDELDADPWLLNTPNCTIDLRTGVQREHRREDMITKRTATRFEPGARSELWDRVLSEAMTDSDLVAFFQRASGYSCTGLTSEEVLFMVVGLAASGKSTVIEAIRKALGEYSKTADFEAFVDKRNSGGPKNEIARLAGSRLVVSIEVDEGKKLAHGLVKTLTGGDNISARFLFKEAFEFVPTFTLWLVCNDAPIVSDEDSGMWRRIVRIPFDHVVPEEKRDPKVKETLLDPQVSGPAILAWIVEGCIQWQAKRLAPPDTVKQATADYRKDQDPLRDFLGECCTVAPGLHCTRRDLRSTYETWVEEAGARVPITGAELNKRVRRIEGVTEDKVHGVRGWSGIGVQAGARGSDERSNHHDG